MLGRVVLSFTLVAGVAGCECSPGRPGGRADAGTPDANLPDTGTIVPVDAWLPPWDTGPITDCMGHPTHVRGTTYAPNGTDPLPRVVVAAFPDDATFDAAPGMVSCEQCRTDVPGAIAYTRSNPDGTFTLQGPGLDGGGNYTIVIMSGGFRRVVRHVAVPMCGDLDLTAAQSSLPGASSGDDLIPRIAVASTTASTGDVNDKFAHVLDVIGITGYERFAPDKNGTPAPPMDMLTLLGDASMLNQYQILIAPCGAMGNFGVASHLTTTMVTNLQSWLAAGGRLYASDLAYEVVAQSYPAAMTFATGATDPRDDPADVGQGITSGTSIGASVDDARLLAWLQLVHAVPAGSSTLQVYDLRDPWAAIDQASPTLTMPDAMGVSHESVLVSADVRWHTGASGHHPLTIQADYPNGSGGYCGRVVFTSYHVQVGTGTSLTPQERVLEYLFFQLSDCIINAPI